MKEVENEVMAVLCLVKSLVSKSSSSLFSLSRLGMGNCGVQDARGKVIS